MSQFWLAKNFAIFYKYSAKKWNTVQILLDYKIQPFLAEKNTKKFKHLQVTKWLAFLVDFLLKVFILKLTISHVTCARMRLHTFHVYYWISNSMVSRAIWKNIHSWVFQRLQIALVLWTRAILIVFEKLTRALFFPNCTRNHTYTNYFKAIISAILKRHCRQSNDGCVTFVKNSNPLDVVLHP